jgi:chemotaxis response regulator CheB
MNEFPIMALVSSAGGLDATATILARLPSDLPAAADHRTGGAV